MLPLNASAVGVINARDVLYKTEILRRLEDIAERKVHTRMK